MGLPEKNKGGDASWNAEGDALPGGLWGMRPLREEETEKRATAFVGTAVVGGRPDGEEKKNRGWLLSGRRRGQGYRKKKKIKKVGKREYLSYPPREEKRRRRQVK